MENCICSLVVLEQSEHLFYHYCRFESLEPEMNNLGARVTHVNDVAEQLLNSENCRQDQIHQTKDQLNNRLEQYFSLDKPLLLYFSKFYPTGCSLIPCSL